MNKQELIDKAVIELKGLVPTNTTPRNNGDFFISRGMIHKDWCAQHPLYSFGIEEFNKRARELGWINGYKWGKEYETNGKKPDLPDDVKIHIQLDDSNEHFANEWLAYSDITIGNRNWSHKITKFRIVDNRFKPVEVGQGRADWYDYDKQQAIALPPVGVECESKHKQANPDWARPDFYRTTPVFFGEKLAIFKDKFGHETVGSHVDYLFRPLDWNRKANEERQELIDVIISAGNISDGMLADAILAAGFTKNKAAS